MVLEESINELLRQTINKVIGVENYAIRAKQKDGLRPKINGAYADVDFVSDTSIGWEEQSIREQTDDGLVVTNSGLREIMMSVSFYRENAIDNARRFHTSLVRSNINSLFKASKLALTRRSEVRHISTALEDSWEQRAQFDIILSSVNTDIEIVNCIEDVEVEAYIGGIGRIQSLR